MSGQIFISYRREESRWSARSLFDRLTQRFDWSRIFMDVDSNVSEKTGARTAKSAVI
jgi:hypothetical protein